MDLDFLGSSEERKSYWNSKVTYFAGQEGLSSLLPDVGQLLSSFELRFVGSTWHSPPEVSINASRLDEYGLAMQYMGLSLLAAQDYYNAGYSLCFGDLSDHLSTVRDLREVAAGIFGYPETIIVTAYLSPPGAVSVLHYDTQHNFFIQREGVKRWFVGDRAATNNPHENLVYNGLPQIFFDDLERQGYKIYFPSECGQTDFSLAPGDVLYVPPGFYHSAETGEHHSLHYTLTIEPACFLKDFRQHIYKRLLQSDGLLFEDYRLLSETEKKFHTEKCLRFILDSLDI